MKLPRDVDALKKFTGDNTRRTVSRMNESKTIKSIVIIIIMVTTESMVLVIFFFKR